MQVVIDKKKGRIEVSQLIMWSKPSKYAMPKLRDMARIVHPLNVSQTKMLSDCLESDLLALLIQCSLEHSSCHLRISHFLKGINIIHLFSWFVTLKMKKFLLSCFFSFRKRLLLKDCSKY